MVNKIFTRLFYGSAIGSFILITLASWYPHFIWVQTAAKFFVGVMILSAGVAVFFAFKNMFK